MNISLLLLIILIFICLAFLCYESFRNTQQVLSEKNTYILNLNKSSCFPNQDIKNLPSINTNTMKCCAENGIKSSKMPFSITPTLKMIIDTENTDYKSACLGYCQTFDSNNECVDGIDTLYGSCISKLKPTTTCYEPALPVAQTNGTILYYAQEPYVVGGSQCSSLVPC
jgi:hypothetical protein